MRAPVQAPDVSRANSNTASRLRSHGWKWKRQCQVILVSPNTVASLANSNAAARTSLFSSSLYTCAYPSKTKPKVQIRRWRPYSTTGQTRSSPSSNKRSELVNDLGILALGVVFYTAPCKSSLSSIASGKRPLLTPRSALLILWRFHLIYLLGKSPDSSVILNWKGRLPSCSLSWSVVTRHPPIHPQTHEFSLS